MSKIVLLLYCSTIMRKKIGCPRFHCKCFQCQKSSLSLNIFEVFSICHWSFLEYTKKVQLALVLSWSKVFPRF